MSGVFTLSRLAALLMAAALASAPAMAEKPEWAGQGGKGNKHGGEKHGGGKHAEKADKGRKGGDEVRVGAYFSDRDRAAARSYYSQEYRGGKSCPPGLAKKNNGCMPPGQAKKWAVGKPLPADVVMYPVPQPVLIKLPPPPSGHKYVRVAADILLIAVGTGMVVDGINDLLNL